MRLSYLRCVYKIFPYSLAVSSSVKFKHCFKHSSIDVLQIYVSAEDDKIKTIENIFQVMKQ